MHGGGQLAERLAKRIRHAADGLVIGFVNSSVINRFQGDAAHDAGRDGAVWAKGGDAPRVMASRAIGLRLVVQVVWSGQLS
jgi:hypothetical protein